MDNIPKLVSFCVKSLQELEKNNVVIDKNVDEELSRLIGKNWREYGTEKCGICLKLYPYNIKNIKYDNNPVCYECDNLAGCPTLHP